MKMPVLALVTLTLVAGCDVQSMLNPSAKPVTKATPPSQMPPGVAPPTAAPANVDGAIKDVDSQLKDKPDDVYLLKSKANLLAVQANAQIQSGNRDAGYAGYEESGNLWCKIKAASPQLNEQDSANYTTAIYNLACALSLKKEIEPAIAAIKEAMEGGFAQTALLTTDTDLDNLREHVDFKAIIAELPKLRLVAAKKHISDTALFPFEFSLPNLKGEAITSRSYEGKVLIVDVWGTWCPPCRKEIPHFVALHQKFRDKGFDIVGINYERTESPEEGRKLIVDYAAANNIAYNCVIGDESTQQKIPAFQGFPTTLFIDRQGRVRAKMVGYHDYDDLEAMVEVLLAETMSSVQ